jgi:hypothetical protein
MPELQIDFSQSYCGKGFYRAVSASAFYPMPRDPRAFQVFSSVRYNGSLVLYRWNW